MSAPAAHGEHGDRRHHGVPARVRPDDGQSGADGGGGEVAECHADLEHVELAEQVAGGHPEQLAPTDRPDRLDGRGAAALPPSGRLHLGPQRVQGVGGELVVAGQHLHGLRCPGEQRDGVPAGGEDPRQLLGHRALVAQRPQIPGRGPERLGDLAEGQQPRVRVGRAGKPAEHRRQQLALDLGLAGDALTERGDVPQRRLRVGVAQRLQPVERGVGGQPQLGAGDPGDDVEQR